jgi:hypothetical protein
MTFYLLRGLKLAGCLFQHPVKLLRLFCDQG